MSSCCRCRRRLLNHPLSTGSALLSFSTPCLRCAGLSSPWWSHWWPLAGSLLHSTAPCQMR